MSHDFIHDPRFKGMEPLKERVFLATPTLHKEDEWKYIKECYETGWLTTVGENIDRLEETVGEYMSVAGCRKKAVALVNGTAAIHLAVKLAAEKIYHSSSGISTPNGKGAGGSLYGKRVFVSDLTFGATVNPILYEGGEPVFIDSEYESWNMNPEALRTAFKLYPDVKIVIFVCLYGMPGKIAEIRRICEEHGAVLIEDAAESLGAAVSTGGPEGMPAGNESQLPAAGCGVSGPDLISPGIGLYAQNGGESNHPVIGTCRKTRCPGGKHAGEAADFTVCEYKTGAVGDYGIISFNGNKILTGSSGGMLIVPDEYGYNRAKKWSTQSREAAPWYEHEELGYNYRISNVVAGIVRGQWGHLSEHIRAKKAVYDRYVKGLKDLPVTLHGGGNYWLSCALIDREAMASAERGSRKSVYETVSGRSCPTEILEALDAFNAEGRPVWKPMHMQPVYRSNDFVTAKGLMRGGSDAYAGHGDCASVTEDIFERGLCLPSDNKMTAGEQDAVTEVIRRCFL